MEPYAYWMIGVFVIGYLFITLEHVIKIDKATVALLMGIGCWVIQFAHAGPKCENSLTCLGEHIANISQVVFFLLGALAIVEIVNVHNGFAIISSSLRLQSKRSLLWAMCFLAFFLSAILDNLTTTIVMITLLRKLVQEGEARWLIGGGIVIAANAGGAWTPIGDVTTTMLWIGGQVSTLSIMGALFFPSIISMAIALLFLSMKVKGELKRTPDLELQDQKLEPMGGLVFFLGVAVLVFVPIFKVLTGLPPFMGILFGLSVLWLVTDLLHYQYAERAHLRMPSVFAKVDISALIFFLGILLAIDALDAAKILDGLAKWLDQQLHNPVLVATLIGLASAVVDNVPLVAATMGMYGLDTYPMDDRFWQLIAYCAGTGGSILIIGSAAGVVYMGMEKVNFWWYLKRISISALAAYFGGLIFYFILHYP